MIENIDIKKSKKNIEYFESLKFMERKVKSILSNKENEMIWFLNHDHIYTCGASANKNEILFETDIPILKTNRGGKTTYHGPGQRIVYLMINLNKRKKDIRKFVSLIEQSIILLLKDFDIKATTFPKRVGIWVTKSQGTSLIKEKKIGAIGIRVSKWITSHGLSFNINPNLDYYKKINACGLKDYKSTSLNDLNCNLSINEFDKNFLKYFLKNLQNF